MVVLAKFIVIALVVFGIALPAKSDQLGNIMAPYEADYVIRSSEIESDLKPFQGKIESYSYDLQSRYYLLLARASFRQSRFKESLSYVGKIYAINELEPQPVNLLLKVKYAESYSLISLNQLDQATVILKDSIEQASKHSVPDMEILHTTLLAAVLRSQLKYQDDMLLLDDAEDVISSDKFSLLPNDFSLYLKSEVYSEKAHLYRVIGDTSKSAVLFEKCLAISKELGLTHSLKYDLYNLSSAYFSLRDFDQAEKLLLQLLEMPVNGLNQTPMLFAAATKLARVYLRKSDVVKAEFYINKVQAMASDVEDFRLLMNYNLVSAEYSLEKGRLDQAKKLLFDDERKVYRNIDRETEFRLRLLRSHYWRMRGKFNFAFNEVHTLYQDHQSWMAKEQRRNMDIIREIHGLELDVVEQKYIANNNKLRLMALEREAEQVIIYAVAVASVVCALLLVIIVQRRNKEIFKNLAEKDYLTNVYNRRVVYERGESLLQDPTSDLCLLMIDLDHFKSLNDSYGHNFGDEVLVQVARLGREVIRNEDVFGRVGGEEFMFVLKNSNIETAWSVADRFNQKLKQIKLSRQVNITASIGISYSNNVADDFDKVVHFADIALYDAKSKGRDRIEIYKAAA